jgi:transcriptional regulator with XRE-family HTH domain
MPDQNSIRKPTAEDVSAARELAHTRKAVSISQETLAAHLNISPQQLSKIETGRNRMSVGMYRTAMQFLTGHAVPESYDARGFASGTAAQYVAEGHTIEPKKMVTELDNIDAAVARLRDSLERLPQR